MEQLDLFNGSRQLKGYKMRLILSLFGILLILIDHSCVKLIGKSVLKRYKIHCTFHILTLEVVVVLSVFSLAGTSLNNKTDQP